MVRPDRLPGWGDGTGHEVDVAIVGGGAAGLACAARLRAHGLSSLVLEATGTLGGRARTSTPGFLAGGWIDEGASWLHAPKANPLVAMARAAGSRLEPAWSGRNRHLFVDGVAASEADEAAYRDAEARWRAAVLDHPDADPSLAAAAGAVRTDDPWAASVEHWECTIIAAADADRLGRADWRANELPGGDLLPADGLGRLVQDLLVPDSGAVRLRTPVTSIDRRAGGHVSVGTPSGTIRAGAVVVTVSTGVLASGAIAFEPDLPDATAAAIARLPMGLLSKVVLRLRDGSAVPPRESLLERRLRVPGEAAMPFVSRPRGTDQLIGFVGGRAAWSLAKRPEDASQFARDELASMLGAACLGSLHDGAYATGWGTDPYVRGAYAYAGPGDHAARGALAVPVDGGRLVFAGEACRTDGLAGTVGGAVLDGRRAADAVAAGLERRLPPAARSV